MPGLELQPNDYLKFRFELRKQIPSILKLSNTTGEAIAFKVKTTAPQKYAVKPNTGIVPPGGSAEVRVVMQSQKEWPADFALCKDKFLVQSATVDGAAMEELRGAGGAKAYVDLFGAVKPAGGVAATPALPGAGPVTEAKLRVQYNSPAPPPSPVVEDAGEGVTPGAPHAGGGGDAPPPLVAAGDAKAARAGADAALAARERAQAVDDRSELARRLAAVQTERDGLKQQLAVAAGAAARARSAVPFTLLHLLLTALVAFCLGRYT